MSGGLANQTFQYIFSRYLEETTKSRVFIDNSRFDEFKAHNGHELEYVFPNIKKSLLFSEYFKSDIWREMITKIKTANITVAQQLLRAGMDLTMLVEYRDINSAGKFTGKILRTPPYKYNSAVAKIPGNIYYAGYWINSGWFNAYKDILLKELSFRPINNARNKLFENEICRSQSIGIHIRRGDYIKLNWALPESYYYCVISSLSKQYPNATYFIFSDNIEWCKQNAMPLGFIKKQTIFIEGNYDYKNNYIDLLLMTLCKKLVVGVSSFGYLAAILNEVPGFQAIHTKNIFENDIQKPL